MLPLHAFRIRFDRSMRLCRALVVRSTRTAEVVSRTIQLASLGVAGVVLVLDILRPRGGLPIRPALLMLVVMYAVGAGSLLRQLAPPFLFSLGLLLERTFWLTRNPAGGLSTDLLVLIGVNAAGFVIASRRISLEREIAVRLRAELNALAEAQRAFTELSSLAALKGLAGAIPVCTNCKKIRFQTGDWKPLEEYVRQHPEIGFSEGFCTDCLRSFYRTLRKASDPPRPPPLLSAPSTALLEPFSLPAEEEELATRTIGSGDGGPL